MRTARTKSTAGPMIALLFSAALLLLLIPEGRAFAVPSTLPPYKSSGGISGTDLLYEGLVIDAGGTVTIVIANPGRAGESFVANFSFYTEKGDYLTGFSVDGFAGRLSRTRYRLTLPNHRSMARAAYMRVLGRSGRISE